MITTLVSTNLVDQLLMDCELDEERLNQIPQRHP